jgi:hypothetical protein
VILTRDRKGNGTGRHSEKPWNKHQTEKAGMEAINYLLNLPKHISVAFNLTTTSGQQLKKAGTLLVSDPPAMEIKVLSENFPPPEKINLNSDCLVFIETGEVATILCTITDIKANGTVHIRAREVIQHSNKRKHFRGPAGRLSIYYRQKQTEKDNSNDLKVFQAGGVNISCGGMLMIVDQPLIKKEILALDIQTPEPSHKVISCHGMVVRIKALQDSYVVAVKFTDLDSDMCDDIMAFCFAEQRRMLREMVIPKNL